MSLPPRKPPLPPTARSSSKDSSFSKDRVPTPEEVQIWGAVTQSDTWLPHAQLNKQVVEDALDSPPPLPHADETLLATMLMAKPFEKAGDAHAPTPTKGGIDRNTARRLRQGKFTIEGKLDMHGLKRSQAKDTLCSFLEKGFEQQKRCVLVVTGKGRFRSEAGISEGILRQELPRWLAQEPCSHWVLRHEQAQPQHGGEGAFYVLLRRKR
ncbi:MAG: Smr/MutS family protein [Alphaproteobacteria bacterium]|nr:Smr/MutS family protein [Alphaproteobacteria bacterium]